MIQKLFITILVFVFSSGCTFVNVHHGPPGHAKAYGHHKKHVQYVYRYYPDLEIYWHPYAGTWTVFQGGTWVTIHKRPAIITSGYTYKVINHKAAGPWKNHGHYKKKHPKKVKVIKHGKKNKNKGKGKGKKW